MFADSHALVADAKSFQKVMSGIVFPSDMLTLQRIRADSRLTENIRLMLTEEQTIVLYVFDALLKGEESYAAVPEFTRKKLAEYYVQAGLFPGMETAKREVGQLVTRCAEKLPMLIPIAHGAAPSQGRS